MKPTRWFVIVVLCAVLLAFSGSPAVAWPGHPEPAAPEAPAAAAPATAWVRTLVDGSTQQTGYENAITVDARGRTWMSYLDSQDDLRVAHWVGEGGNCGPGSSWQCETVDSQGTFVLATSIDSYLPPNPILRVFGPRIGVAYYDAVAGSLRFAERTCSLTPQGELSCAWRKTTITPGVHASYAQAISFRYHPQTGQKAVAFQMNEQQIIPAFPVPEIRNYQSLAVALEVGDGGSCFQNPAWDCEVVDEGGGPSSALARFLDLAWDADGKLRVAYAVPASGEVNLATRGPSNGVCSGPASGEWFCEMIDSPAEFPAGWQVRLEMSGQAHDVPTLAYFNAGDHKLYVARPAKMQNGNCGEVNNWVCEAITGFDGLANPEIVRRFFDLVVRPDGSLALVYANPGVDGQPYELSLAQPALFGNCGPSVQVSQMPSLKAFTWSCKGIGGKDPADQAGVTRAGADLAAAVDSRGNLAIAYQLANVDSGTSWLYLFDQQYLLALPQISQP